MITTVDLVSILDHTPLPFFFFLIICGEKSVKV